MHVIGQSSARRYTNITRDTQRGRRSRICFEGTTAAIYGQAAAIDPKKYNTEIDATEAPFARLYIDEPDVTDGSTSDVQETWELLANSIQKPVLEHPSSLVIPDTYLDDIKDHFEQNLAFYPVWLAPGWTPAPPAAAVTLFELLRKGTTHFQTFQYVLRHTRVVPGGKLATIRFDQAGYIFPPAKIIASAGVPSDVVFSITEITVTTPGPPGNLPGYQWGWLKQAPQADQVSGNKWRITEEWWFELWSTYLYLIIP